LIAQVPLADRAGSRLLHLDRQTGLVEHLKFRDAVDLLHEGDLLVLNDTRVSALRLQGVKPTGGSVEALLLGGTAPEYDALVRPGKRLHPGAEIHFEDLKATVVSEQEDGLRRLRFEDRADLVERINALGQTPLPPYIHERLGDKERYQTVYGRNPGSAAAPTAGLHFTEEVLDAVKAKGCEIAYVTLHVGLDTFRPVQVEDLSDHRMHGEACSISDETAETINRCAGRIIAVGTTAVRTLESFAVSKGKVHSGSKISCLFIKPGFKFQIVDGMFTNFHLPKTTMLVMLSALCGRDTVLSAYDQAVKQGYRFLSFGDSMLVL
jgi:S-adenosylmethionine:tRNA ribosyltransferase-isomerase